MKRFCCQRFEQGTEYLYVITEGLFCMPYTRWHRFNFLVAAGNDSFFGPTTSPACHSKINGRQQAYASLERIATTSLPEYQESLHLHAKSNCITETAARTWGIQLNIWRLTSLMSYFNSTPKIIFVFTSLTTVTVLANFVPCDSLLTSSSVRVFYTYFISNRSEAYNSTVKFTIIQNFRLLSLLFFIDFY